MGIADSITALYPSKSTTMRDMPFDKTVGEDLQRKITRMQSAQQIGAMLYMFGNLDACFSPMFAIQLAAFLMTMVRKNIIDSTAWHSLYNMSLWINIFCFWSLPLEYVVVQPFVNYGVYYWRFSFDRRTHLILGNKYLGLIAAYMVLRSGAGEKMVGFINNDAEHVVRNAIIMAYFAAQYCNLK